MSETIKQYFKLEELNTKINNLLSNGFEQYLDTWEKVTVHGDLNMYHEIYTATKGDYDGVVVDIYYNEDDKRCWLEYSGQRKDTIIKTVN